MSIRKVTARDVAECAGVSRSLVSMYLNRNPKVWISEAAKRRIDDAVRELQYRPNRAAQLLRGGRSHIVGVILGRISGPVASCFAESLMTRLEDAGYRVILGITRYEPERERELLESMMQLDVDALVYTLHPEYVEEPLRRCAAACPVFLAEYHPDHPFHCVRYDLGGALTQTAHYLAGRGVKRVALLTDSGGYGEREFLSVPEWEAAGMRFRSFRCGTALRPVTGIVAELRHFQPDALISFAGIDGGSLREQLGGSPLWIDSWSLPFMPLARSDGSIVPGFRAYVELLAEALLEVMGDPGGATRDLLAPVRFLVPEERTAVREAMNNDPFFQTLGQGAVTWQCR